MSIKRRIGGLVLLMVVASFAVGCAGNDDGDGDSGGDSANADMRASDGGGGERADYMAEEDSDGFTVQSASGDRVTADVTSVGAPGGGIAAAPLPEVGPKVIKTANIRLELERDGFRDSIDEAISIAERHGGFILSSDVASGDGRNGELVVRVPAEQFEATLNEIKGVGEKVTGESISGQDVSQEFVDLQARIRNFQAQESVLLELMEEATTISESIRVQNELARVQLDIERLKGRANFLEDQTAYSTISVRMTEVGVAPPKPKSTLGRAWADAKEAFLGVISAVVVGAGTVVPVAFLIALIALIFRALWPRLDLAKR